MNWFKSLRTKTEGGVVQKLLALIALVIVALVAYLLFVRQGGIVVDIRVPEEVVAGQIFEAEVTLANDSEASIEEARIVLHLPDGLRLLDHSDRINEERGIGEVRSGGVARETYRLVVLPSTDKAAHELKVTALYSTPTIQATLEKSKSKNVEIGDSGFDFALESPENISLGQAFTGHIKYRVPEQEEESLGKFVSVTAPGLIITSAEPEIASEDGDWPLEMSEEEKEIEFTAVVREKTTDVVPLVAKAFINFGGEEYVLRELRKDLLVAPSPLTLDITLEDPKSFASPEELLTYKINYRNNTGSDLRDGILRASLVGDMFDLGTIKTSGSLNQNSRTVTWDSGSFAELREIKNGDSGFFTLQIRVRGTYPITKISDKDFTLRVTGVLESPTVIPGTGEDRTRSEDTLEIKVAGRVSVDAKGFFRDAPSGILNEGPFPPRVNAATQYTLHWLVKNYGTDVANLVVRAKLADGVNFTGEVSASTENMPEFDEETREVTWRIDSLRATTGALGDPVEAIFQVEATPTFAMIGQYMSLIGFTTISAEDEFTGLELSGTHGALTTELADDGSVAPGDGTVRSY